MWSRRRLLDAEVIADESRPITVVQFFYGLLVARESPLLVGHFSNGFVAHILGYALGVIREDHICGCP